MFAHHGIPQRVYSSNGPPFNSDEFAQFAKREGFKQQRYSQTIHANPKKTEIAHVQVGASGRDFALQYHFTVLLRRRFAAGGSIVVDFFKCF